MDNSKLKNRMSGKVQELQTPVEVAAAPDTSLAPVDSGYLALSNNALDIIRANLKSQPLTLDLFDIVKSPSVGSTVFEVPGLAGNEAAMELTGIVLDYTILPCHTPRHNIYCFLPQIVPHSSGHFACLVCLSHFHC